MQNKKANNINLVTPTQYVPHIIKAIEISRKNGLKIPIVYNTSGYEKVSTIKMLDGTVDIYLTDFKYYDSFYSNKYSNSKDYPEIAKLALEEMYNQVGKPLFKGDIMKKGIIVRVLLLPGLLEDAKKIIPTLFDIFNPLFL